jgi:hypothetical protein
MSVVQAKEFSRNGAAKYQIDGKWYFIDRAVQTQGLEPGASINFQWKEFGEDRGHGRPKTITSWAPATSGNGSYAREQRGAQHSGARHAGNVAQPPQPVSTITEVDILRSVSNVVGSACAAGTVKSPEEVLKWCVAAYSGLLHGTLPPTREPGSDDAQDEPPNEYLDDVLDF